MVYTTAGGRPLKSAVSHPGVTHGGSIDLDAGAIWCRAPERGGPSSEECAREVLSRGKWVRETRSGWGATSRTCSSSSLSLHSVCASRLTHTCVRPEASCVPVRLCRGGPRSGKSTAGSGRTRGRQTGLPELPWIDSRSAGSSRDGVATLRGMWAVVRARRPHDWASPAVEQCAVTWTACDSRWGDGGRAVTCGVIVYLPAGWCTRPPQCCPCGLARACPTAVAGTAVRLNALPTAIDVPKHSGPEAACPLYVAPQPVLEASVVTTVCRDTCSRGTPARRKARSVQGLREQRHCWVIPTRSVPRRHAHLGTRECSQCWSGLIWSNPSGGTAAADAICPRSLWNRFSGTTFLPLKELRQFNTAWAHSSVRHAVILTESNSTLRKEILCTGESLLFSQLTRSPNWLRCRSTKSLWSPNCSLDWARISQSSR